MSAVHTVSPVRPPSTGASGSGAGLKTAPAQPLVTPLGIFVARRKWFEAIACVELDTPDADILGLIFDALPLADHGWLYSKTKIARTGFRGHWPVYRLRRG